jgi:hypothetical protein
MPIFDTRAWNASRIDLSRSWVNGRFGFTPSKDKAMAMASLSPIHMGNVRSPNFSFNKTT